MATITITGERLKAMYDNDMAVFATPGASQPYWASRPSFMFDECVATVEDLWKQAESDYDFDRDDIEDETTYTFEVELVEAR